MSGWPEYLQDCWADLLTVLERIALALEKIADGEASRVEDNQP